MKVRVNVKSVVGGFEGELLFDPMIDTIMKYRTIMLECALCDREMSEDLCRLI